MLKITIKQLALFFVFSFVALLFTTLIYSLTNKNDDLAAIIWLILELFLIVNFIRKVVNYKRSLHQANLSIQPTRPAPINKEIVIEYCDSEGEVTTRKIRVKEVKYDKYKRKMVPYSLYSYCFLKKAPRTFVIHNIISAYDAETGEIIYDIPKYLMQ